MNIKKHRICKEFSWSTLPQPLPDLGILLLVLPLMAFSRLCLLWFNSDMFAGMQPSAFLLVLAGGLRFDLSVVLMLNLPYLILVSIPAGLNAYRWYRLGLRWLFIGVNSMLLLPNYIDSIYYRYTMKRLTGDFLSYAAAEAGDITALLPKYMVDFWPVVLLWVLSVFILVLASRYIKKPVLHSWSKCRLVMESGLFVLLMVLTVVGIRGGLQLKPITIITAGKYAAPRFVPLVFNSPFSMVKTWNMKGLEPVQWFQDEKEMKTLFNPVKNEVKITLKASQNQVEKQNVVIIILESFSTEHIGALTHKRLTQPSLTPFLDSLINESLSLRGISNSKRSIEALPAVLAGLPSLMNQDLITSPYAGNRINSLATVLKPHGYHTAFFHGGNNGTMGFDAFCRMAGIGEYYGRNEYGNDKDFDGKWGIWDEAFFGYFGKKLGEFQQPFLASIFSLSSHHPYRIPDKYTDRFNKAASPLENTIAYTDFALSRFFSSIRNEPWFANTLFVITADHTSETKDPWYQSRTGMYSIPIVFYTANGRLKGKRDLVAQQTDIMPSVLDYLGVREGFIAFGNSVFDPNARHFALNYLAGSYCLAENDYSFIFENDQAVALYKDKNDPMLTHNLLKESPDIARSMEKLLKSVVQQYNYRMIYNQLTID